MNKPELLAPAGGWDALAAAVENGADAVYLGGKLFNARQSADNFDDQELSRAVEYAHLRGVKIYVTVNTLVADSEMEEALEFLFGLQNTGVDAAILQDKGLASLAQKVLPELPLHASTQMTAHNSSGVRELMGAGFSRVVLAREMSLEEITEIQDSTGADLEVFIHGALCISYSGQCLLSSMIGGRSGNRGRCAQPCRMQYNLIGRGGSLAADSAQAGEYLLSPRDLNVSSHIFPLMQAGINSFKIEGRMKRPEYVATVVRIYRKLIDCVFSEGPYPVDEKDKGDLAQIFNRDFTTGYFFGNQGRDMMSCKRPNNRGVRLGRVRGFDRKAGLVEVNLERSLRIGDGLEVWVTEGGRVGFQVSEIFIKGVKVDSAPAGEVAGLNIPGRVNPGDRVFKTHDANLMEMAKESFNLSRARRKVPVIFKVQAGPAAPLEITAIDPEGRRAAAATNSIGSPAEKRPLDGDFLKSQLDRLGNTPFAMAGLVCQINGRVIYPVKEINEARRQALSRLEAMIARDRRKPPVDPGVFRSRLKRQAGESYLKTDKTPALPILAVSVADVKSLQSAVAAGADIVYFSLEGFRSKPSISRDQLTEAALFCKKNHVAFFLSTPRIVKDNEMEVLLGTVENIQAPGVLAGNLGLIPLLAQRAPGLPLVTDFGFNAFNRHTVEFLLNRGASRVTLSPELTMAQVKELAPLYPVEVFIHGALEVMVSEHCLPGSVLGDRSSETPCRSVCHQGGYSLKDRIGAAFPVETDRHCRMHIFNSRDLFMFEAIPDLAAAGVACVRIEARRESPDYVLAAAGLYRKALDGLQGGRRPAPDAEQARERMIKFSPAGVTKGHYYRGV